MLKNKKVLIGIIVTLIIILLCVILYFALGNNTKTYTITFDTDGGSSINSIEAEKNEKVKLPTNVEKEGYSFDGWKKSNGKIVSNNYVVTENITLKAIWKEELNNEKVENEDTIKVSFNTDGGSKIDDIILEKGKELILPKAPTKEGYTFKVWVDKNENPIYDKVLLSDDTELKAVWEKKKSEEDKIEYYCDEGYNLEGTKCTKEKTKEATINKSCPNGMVDNNVNCLNTSDTKQSIKTCKKVDNYSTGLYVDDVNGCFYGEKGNVGIDKNTCETYYSGKYYNGHCYEKLIQGGNTYTTTCDDGYALYTPKNNNPLCAKIVEKDITYSCDEEYTLKDKICIKIITIDAKVK